MFLKKKHKSQHNYLSERVVEILQSMPKGKLLDLGCGHGDTSWRLSQLGFEVIGADMDVNRFQHHDKLLFVKCDLREPLQVLSNTYDYVVFLEVIEHVYNPGMVISEISRILKPGGKLIISTPNIQNIGSRLRFLFEGAFDFFREPLVEYAFRDEVGLQNVHVIPWRYNELEYLLSCHRLKVDGVFSDEYAKGSSKFIGALFRPFLVLQAWLKEARSRRNNGVDYKRMNRILLADALFYGRHMILLAEKQS